MKTNVLAKVGTSITSHVGRAGLKIQKYSPELLLAGGIVAIVGGTILACKETLKAEEVLDEHYDKLETIDKAAYYSTFHRDDEPSEYTEEDHKKDLAITYVQTGWNFVRLYAPSVTLISTGIGCILASYGILHKRNVALMAAYKLLETGFGDYRTRVRDELGEEKDREFLYGTEKKPDGKKKKDSAEEDPSIAALRARGIQPSVYARWFDESSRYWVKNAENNRHFLNIIQSQANDLLRSRGHVFLNEVYDMLDIPRTQAGAVVGWIKDGTDKWIDFGMYDVDREGARDFINGYERSIMLDFNVDGVIWDLI